MTPEECRQMDALCVRIQRERSYAAFVSLSRELGHLIERKALRFGCSDGHEWRRNQPWKISSAVVTKILKSLQPADPDTVEIQIPSAQDLFREIRIENKWSGLHAEHVVLQSGDHLDVTFEVNETRG